MNRLRIALLLTATLASCRTFSTFDPNHPLLGRPQLERPSTQPGMWLWVERGVWQVRFAGRGSPHRFQGTLTGVTGSVAELALNQPALREAVALAGGAVQFDLESSAATPSQGEGFAVRILGGCGRFELLVDGKAHPEWIHLGPEEERPEAVPFEGCP